MFTTTNTLNDEWDQIRAIEIDWHDCPELMHCIDVDDVLAVIPAAVSYTHLTLPTIYSV